MKANNDIRNAAKLADVKLWQVAERYGCIDSTFSRKLRREFQKEEKRVIMDIIQALSEEGR